jgi:hypothetical protein
VTTFAVFVASATYFLDWDLKLSNGVVPLLSVVVGLLLVFRNGSAYGPFSSLRPCPWVCYGFLRLLDLTLTFLYCLLVDRTILGGPQGLHRSLVGFSEPLSLGLDTSDLASPKPR